MSRLRCARALLTVYAVTAVALLWIGGVEAQQDDAPFDWQLPDHTTVQIMGKGAEDSDGNKYFVGAVTADSASLPSNIFVGCIGANGSVAWTREFGSADTDAANFVTVLNDSVLAEPVLLVVGTTWGYMDEGAHVLNSFGHYGGRDVVLIKMSLDGTKDWIRQFGTTANDYGYGVVLEASFRTVLLTGICTAQQINTTVEMDVREVMETRQPLSPLEPQLMDAQMRRGMRGRTYRFAASYNLQGDLLDYTMDGGITLSPRRVRTREGGQGGEYAVVLNRQPLHDVVVKARVVPGRDPFGAPLNQLSITTNRTLRFTPSNWNIEQLVRVRAVDDNLAEGSHFAVIAHSSTSKDPNYNGAETPFVLGSTMPMRIQDNDAASITISRRHLYVGEGGLNDSYAVRLTSQPWHPVVVHIQPLRPLQTAIAPNMLLFDATSWNVSQVVHVSAVDDTWSEVEYGGLHYGGEVIHYSESRDFRYNTRRPQCFDVVNCDPITSVCLDVDQPDSNILRVCDIASDCRSTLGNGTCVSNVSSTASSVPPQFGVGTQLLAVLPATFPSDYSGLRSVLDDTALDQVRLNESNLTAVFDFKQPTPELRGFVLSLLGLLNVEEAAAVQQSYRASLRLLCTAVERLESHAWMLDDWPQGRVQEVMATALDMFDGVVSARHLWNCGAGTFQPSSRVSVSTWDNDAGVTLSKQSLRVHEQANASSIGASDTYTLVLNAPPSNGPLKPLRSFCQVPGTDACGFWSEFTVLAPLMYDTSAGSALNLSIGIVGNAQVQVSPSFVTFTATNWYVPQTVIVTAVNDLVAELPALNVTLTHVVESRGNGYGNTTAFWFQHSFASGALMHFGDWGDMTIAYNAAPDILHCPMHTRVNVVVEDDDTAAVDAVIPQPNRRLQLKEHEDDMDWLGDYINALAFSDVSLSSSSSNGLTTALKNVLVLATNATTLFKFHLPTVHAGDTGLAFRFAKLRLQQTPFKVVNASASVDSDQAANDNAQSNYFAKTYRLRVSVVTSKWTRVGVSSGADTPTELSYLANPRLELSTSVERARYVDLDLTPLIQQVLPLGLSVVALRMDVLEANAADGSRGGSTQLCSSAFERRLRPMLQFGYSFRSLTQSNATTAQSSTLQDTTPASRAIDGVRAGAGSVAAATQSEWQPWWETTLSRVQRIGAVAVFLAPSMASMATEDYEALNITIIAALQPFQGKPLSLEEARRYGCPQACPKTFRTLVRRRIVLWQVDAGAGSVRIYLEGNGSLALSEVEIYDSFVPVATTANQQSLRPRAKADWTSRSVRNAWRIQHTTRQSLQENLARGMPTRQSSTDPDYAVAALGVDGLRAEPWDELVLHTTNGTPAAGAGPEARSTRTRFEASPWWEVDLGATVPIRSITLYPYVGERGRGYCGSAGMSSAVPTWAGSLYRYAMTDPLLLLQDPFLQSFDVFISTKPLDEPTTTVVANQTLSFSCAGGITSVTWNGAFVKGRYVTVQKRGSAVLMLNEVDVRRWNPAVTPRYLLLDLYGTGETPLALSKLQLYPPTDSAQTATIPFKIHSTSSQAQLAGAGSAAALVTATGGLCYIAAAASYHEWVVLDLLKPTAVGLIELGTTVTACGATVQAPHSISIAAHGAPVCNVTKVKANATAMATSTGTCELDAVGSLLATKPALCQRFTCRATACNSQLWTDGAASSSSLVLADFVDIVGLGKVELLPASRLPLLQQEHRALVIRDTPAQLWSFTTVAPEPIAPRKTRWTRSMALSTVDSSLVLTIDDSKEDTFYSNTVALQPIMSGFSLEFWVWFSMDPWISGAKTTVATLTSAPTDAAVIASVVLDGVSGNALFTLRDPVLLEECTTELPTPLPAGNAGSWIHFVVTYDPASASVTLSTRFQTDGNLVTERTNTALCRVAPLSTRNKTLQFGKFSPTAGTGFVGKVTSVAWYVQPLSAASVLDHFHDFFDGAADLKRAHAHCSYTVQLRSKPLTPVVVDLSSDRFCYRFDLCNLTVVPSTLEFQPDNWRDPQVVHVLATNDQLYEGAQIDWIDHHATSMHVTQATAFVITDNATHDMDQLTSELHNHDIDVFMLQVPVDPDLEGSWKSLCTNWTTQDVHDGVVVTANYDDAVNDPPPLPVAIQDLTVPGIQFSTTTLMVSEDGKANDYQIVLLSEPTSAVRIDLNGSTDCYRSCFTAPSLCPAASSSSDIAAQACQSGDGQLLCNVTVVPSVLVFGTSNWSKPQTVRVLAVDDQLDEADLHRTTITATSVSADPIYNALVLPSITVGIEDNDVSDVLYSTTFVALAEKAPPVSLFNLSVNGSYELSLKTEPWANVTIAMSNEANGACYRSCGYHFDEVTCGLPRQQSVSLVRLGTTATQEIQRLQMTLPTVTEVQRIYTFSDHADQIFRVQFTGGFVPEAQRVDFAFSSAFKQRFSSANAVSQTVAYGKTFRLGLSDRKTRTDPIDGFASATAVETALNTLIGGNKSVRVSRTLQYDTGGYSWTVSFVRLLSASAKFPLLSVTVDMPFDGLLSVTQVVPGATPTGSFSVQYGPENPIVLPFASAAADLEGSLRDLDSVYTVAVSRLPLVDTYGVEFRVTFNSVDAYRALVADGAALVRAPASTTSPKVQVLVARKPVLLAGFFQIRYFSPYNKTSVYNTTAVAWNATDQDMADALESLDGIGGNVSVTRKQLTPEGAAEWNIEFVGNHGNIPTLQLKNINLTGSGVGVQVQAVRDAVELGGTFSLSMGGRFKKQDARTKQVYTMTLPTKTTPPIPFNASTSGLAAAIASLGLTAIPVVTRTDLDCDDFAICRGYTWDVSFKGSLGDLPPMTVTGALTGAGAAISAATIANGTYIGGKFSLTLELLDQETNITHTGTTWHLPVNVTAAGMDQAIEALPFVRSNREREFSPETGLSRGIKFDKGVRVYRDGPYPDGGHAWRLEWAIEDYVRFGNLSIWINTSLVTQEVEPLQVPSEFDLIGAPRCGAIPTARFVKDPTDKFGLRGFCVYDLANTTSNERYLCNYTVTNPWIVFTPENWCHPQRVQLRANDDHLDERTPKWGNLTFSNVTHSTFTDDLIYALMPLRDVVVEVESDDVSEVKVSEKYLQVSEDGTLTAAYYLQLASEPTASVKIVVLPWLDNQNTQCYRFGLCNLTLPTSEFVFTPRNWDIPQKVIVLATDDSLDEDNVHATGISHMAYSGDPKYHKLPVPSINVSVLDNDVSALLVYKTTVDVVEGGANDTYNVVLATEPFAKVSVTITNIATRGNFAVATPTRLRFTWRDWNVPQTVTVSAVDDFTQDPLDSRSTMVHAISSNDVIYQNLENLTRVVVRIGDNDVSGLALSASSMQVAEGAAVYTYGVRLTTEPWLPVQVRPNASHDCYTRSLSGERLCNATVLTRALYFGLQNWSTWQNVSFQAFDDALDEPDVHTTWISHASTSLDALYQVSKYPSTSGDLTLYIADNDLSFVNITMAVTSTKLQVAEGGFNDSYQVVLNSEPWDTVQFTITPTIERIVNQDDLSVVRQAQVGVVYGPSASTSLTSSTPGSIQLVFTPLNWFQPRRVAVFGIDDRIPEDATQSSSIQHSVLSRDWHYNISNRTIGVVPLRALINDRESIAPPVPISAMMDSASTRLTVQFDSSVFHAATMSVRPKTAAAAATTGKSTAATLYTVRYKSFSCDFVFTFARAKYSLGRAAYCYWLDFTQLRIELGAGATITVGDVLTLNDCTVFDHQVCQSDTVIRARATSRAYTQASVAVALPSNIVTPKVVLTAPENVGSCGAFSLDGTLSSGGGGRPFQQVQWALLPQAFVSNSTDDPFTRATSIYASVTALCFKYQADWQRGKSSTLLSKAEVAGGLSFLQSMAQLRATCYLRSLAQAAVGNQSLRIQVNTSLVEPGATYMVGLALSNAFAQRTATIKTVAIQTLPGPSVFVLGDSTRQITRVGDPLEMQVNAIVSCPEVLGTKVGYRWSVFTVSNGSDFTPAVLNATNTARDPRVFRVARPALAPEQVYCFNVEAYMLSNVISANSTTSVLVSVLASPLSAALAGTNRAVGTKDTLLLSAAASVDPDATTDGMRFAWACEDLTSSNGSHTCFNGSVFDKDVPLDLSQMASAALSLPPYSLRPKRTLQFTVTVSKVSASTGRVRSASASGMIWTLEGSVPEVHTVALSSKVVPSSRVALNTDVKSAYPYTVRWVEDAGDLVLPDATSKVNTSAYMALPLTSINNVLVKNVLTAGLTYTFRLIATDINGNSGFGTIDVVVNSPPSSGQFFAKPELGYAIDDAFQLECVDWTDDVSDLPLTYAFGVLSQSALDELASGNGSLSDVVLLKKLVTPLVPEQMQPSATASMLPPEGMSDSENVTLVAFITDNLGSSAVAFATIEVMMPEAAKSQPVAFVSSLVGANSTLDSIDDAQKAKVLLSAAMVLQNAFTAASDVAVSDTACPGAEAGSICSGHGECLTASFTCQCDGGYMGTKCELTIDSVRGVNDAILSSLTSAAAVVEPTPGGLTQQALVVDTVLQASPGAFDSSGVDQVTSLTASISQSGLTLQDPAAFLDATGSTLLKSLSTTVAISPASDGPTPSSTSGSASNGTAGRRRLSEAGTTRSATLQTLQFLSAIASQDLLPNEKPTTLKTDQITVVSGAGNRLTVATDGLRINLTDVATPCLSNNLYLNAFLFKTPQHPLSSLNASFPISSSLIFTAHSKKALEAAKSDRTNSDGLQVEVLSGSSVCVTVQAEAAARNANSTTRRLTETATVPTTSTGAAWHPVAVVAVPHQRQLSAIEQTNFSTACRTWSTELAQWDNDVCFKDDATSTANFTVCYCTELGELEVLVTLEERLDFYALYADLYRHDTASITPIVALASLAWLFVLGTAVGKRTDIVEDRKVKDKTVRGLNRAKWAELNARTQSPVLFETFEMYCQLKKEAMQKAEASAVTDAATAPMSSIVESSDALVVTRVDDVQGTELPDEDRVLFGSSERLARRHQWLLRVLTAFNALLLACGVLLLFVGVDFFLVLGNSTHETLLYVYGHVTGIVLMANGAATVALSLLGMGVAYRSNGALWARRAYVALALLLVVAQAMALSVAYRSLKDLRELPNSTAESLQATWAALSERVRAELQATYGCCGFASVLEGSTGPACPEESLEAVPPRTCHAALATRARVLFGNAFPALAAIAIIEIVCIALSHALVKWRNVRAVALASSSTASAAMLQSLVDVTLLCVLPALHSLLACAMAVFVFYGIDLLAQLHVVSSPVVSAILGIDLGLVVLLVALLALVLLLRTIRAFAVLDIRGLQTVVVLQTLLLLAALGVLAFVVGASRALRLDPLAAVLVKTRYTALPRPTLVLLETGLGCCGFDANDQGSCATGSGAIPTCGLAVLTILSDSLRVFAQRLRVYLGIQTVLLVLTAVLVFRLRRFARKPTILPLRLAGSSAPVPNEFTSPLDIVVHNTCLFLSVGINLLAIVLGIVLTWAGLDVMYQLNVLHISYLLRSFDAHVGNYLLAAGGSLGIVGALGLTATWTRSHRVSFLYALLGLALLTAGVAAAAVAFRVSSGQLSTTALQDRLRPLWVVAPFGAKALTQNVFSCCGYERHVAANGSVSFSYAAELTSWSQTNATANVWTYGATLAQLPSTSAQARRLTARYLVETTTQTFTLTVCPSGVKVACAGPVVSYVQGVAASAFQLSVSACVLLVLALGTLLVLLARRGHKDPGAARLGWSFAALRGLLQIKAMAAVVVSLITLALGVDVLAGWSLLTSKLVQMVFPFSVGIALVVYATGAFALALYALHGAVKLVVHEIFLQCMARVVLAMALWIAVGILAYVTHFSAPANWQAHFDAVLSSHWSAMSRNDTIAISEEFTCCGYRDPVLVHGQGIVFDRPPLDYSCSLAITRGCRQVLFQALAQTFSGLFIWLASMATIETLLGVQGALVLWMLKRERVEAWFAVESRVRYAIARYRAELRRRHVLGSVLTHFDAKLTRAQRVTSVATALATTLAVYVNYFATAGCHRHALKTCEQPSWYSQLGMALIYGGATGLVTQWIARYLFELVRHRCDDETTEVTAARQRKEKVLLFRSLFQRRRGLAAPPSSAVMDADTTGTHATAHATTEERWFTWLSRFTLAVFWVFTLLLLVAACGVAAFAGVEMLGYTNVLYGVQVDQGPATALVLGVLVLLTTLLGLLALNLKARGRRETHVVFAVAGGAALLLVAFTAVLMFMVQQAVDVDVTTTTTATGTSDADAPLPNWTVRKTGFDLSLLLDRAWSRDTTGFLRDGVQHKLNCCGFHDATDRAFRPCPTGTTARVDYQAKLVNGTVVAKAANELRDLDGCYSKMVAGFQNLADSIVYCGAGLIVGLLVFSLAAMFLAYDVATARDVKLKLRVSVDGPQLDVRQSFERVVGLKIAAPARGKIVSTMLSSSLDAVAPSVASHLGEAPLPTTKRMSFSSTVDAATQVASLSKPSGQHHSGKDEETDDVIVGAVPYPASIVYVPFSVCAGWAAIMSWLVVHGAQQLGADTARVCVLSWLLGVGFHVLLLEPASVFVLIVVSTLRAWWQRTWVMRLVRLGRALLRIQPDSRTPMERFVASLSLYERIRFHAATRIQRRILTRVLRVRFLRAQRDRRERERRTRLEERHALLKQAIDGFTSQEIQAFQLLFEDADTARLGLVPCSVISQSIYQLGVRVDALQVERFLRDFDPAFVDLVDFDHFLYGMHCVRVHHQKEQDAQAEAARVAAAAAAAAAAGAKDKLVSSAERFGPTADPQSKVLVKRQNLLRELQEKRDSLSYKLLNRMGRLPPILQRSSTGKPAKSAKENAYREALVEEETFEEVDHIDGAPPASTFVQLQNRYLSPKRKSLEVILKKKTRDDRAAKTIALDGSSGSATPKSPAKSTSQRAKNLVTGWKLSPTKVKQGAKIASQTSEPVAPEAGATEAVRRPPAITPIMEERTDEAPQLPVISPEATMLLESEADSPLEAAPVEAASVDAGVVQNLVKPATTEPTEKSMIEPTSHVEVDNGSDLVTTTPLDSSDTVNVATDEAVLDIVVVNSEMAPSFGDANNPVIDATLKDNGGATATDLVVTGDESATTSVRPPNAVEVVPVANEVDASDADTNSEVTASADTEDTVDTEPMPFGTYTLINNKRAAAVGKNKVLEKLMQKQASSGNATARTTTPGSSSRPSSSSSSMSPRSEAAGSPPKTADGKRNLEKALLKKMQAKKPHS
ncbi:TPA: hypothetical protein N0F65_011281 [Lagenidium giganteum]|uniref:EGF-like domain-containing protein n=1 Tax=Lagenidium giganteum TaxID=4803 RepID=A0AAV2YRU6_9STRA|nr:TPA: hypothetical protein N0F65_011281 [Lagenidium giganteum]